MGESVSFPSNGSSAEGYLATAAGGSGGPGVIVIQEWWGLVPHIQEVVDRFAGAGFTALAPDLYHGQKTTEPDEAGKLMMALNMGQAAKDISGAVDYLLSRDETTSEHVGIVGYCMGGGLALYAATLRPDAIKATAPYYGLIPWPDAHPDWSKLDGVIRGHYAENDDMFGPAAVADLQSTLDGLGKDAVLTVHPGTDHAFFNDHRPEVYNAEQSAAAFADTVELFRTAVACSAPSLVDRYLQLGLRLGRHIDGLVDAYYGPPELARATDAEAVMGPDQLGNDARRLVADLDGGAEPELAGQRRRWLRGQVVGLVTVAAKMAGEPISYSDEVEACYGVRPTWVDEEEFTAAHRHLDESLAGDGPLIDRLVAFRDAHAIPTERLRAVIDDLAADFRERTNAMFGLPDGEHIDFDLVSNEPWSGFNYYLGDLHSRVVINTDLPVLATSIGHLVAHEAYPGHHTEHSRKEVGLVRRAGHREESIFLVGTPQCLLAEGLADLGIEVLLGDDRLTVVGDHLHQHKVRYDLEAIDAVSEFAEVSSRGRGNLGLLLHEQGASVDDTIAYAERWFLLDHDRAAKSVQFMMDPTWRAYISCYVEGLPLCRSFTKGDPARFERLLTEQLLPSDLAAA